MKLEVTVNEQKIHALSESELKSVKNGDYPVVVDLRRAEELKNDKEDLSALLKEKEVAYRRVPVAADTISEQDLDKLRWEFARGKGNYAIISRGGTRAAALVLMHAGRTEKWDLKKTLDKCPELAKQKDLVAWVKAYLERHSATTS